MNIAPTSKIGALTAEVVSGSSRAVTLGWSRSQSTEPQYRPYGLRDWDRGTKPIYSGDHGKLVLVRAGSTTYHPQSVGLFVVPETVRPFQGTLEDALLAARELVKGTVSETPKAYASGYRVPPGGVENPTVGVFRESLESTDRWLLGELQAKRPSASELDPARDGFAAAYVHGKQVDIKPDSPALAALSAYSRWSDRWAITRVF